MSSQYEQPQSGQQVTDELQANPSISPGTYSAMSNILGLDNPGSQVNVGGWDGTAPPVAPPGPTQLVIVDIPDGATGQQVLQIPEPFRITPAWVFDSDLGITVTFNTVERVIQMGNGDDVVTVNGDRNTTIDGSAGNDELTLSGGDDSITGGTGNDTVSAGAGDDSIVGVYGLDSVDGGRGFDVLEVQGDVNDWIVSVEGSVVTLSGAPGSSDGVEMRNVNFIQFETAVGEQDSAVVTTTAKGKADAMRLYQAAFDRSADQGGAQFWLDALDRDQTDVVGVASAFLNSTEGVSIYGSQTNSQFIDTIYRNAFDRTPDAAGKAFWLAALDGGAASRAQVLSAIVGSTEAQTDITNVIVVTSIV